MAKIHRVLPVTLAMSLMLSGCFKEEVKKPKAKPIVDRVVTVADIKSSYGYQDKAIMPMFNVSPTKMFSIPFNAYMGDLPLEEVLTVHTDYKLNPDSAIDVDAKPVGLNLGPTTYEIKPSEGVLDGKKGQWGKASTYYLAINYDLDAKEPTKLEKPIVIPFTIKSQVASPDAQLVVGSNGALELKWSKVKGATEYRVYSLVRPTKQAEKLNGTATESGFKGLTQYKIASTKKTSFTDFSLDGKKGLSYNEDKELVEQNKGVKGDYYVTAVVKGKETVASNVVSVLDVDRLLPAILEDNIINQTYDTVRALPKTVKITQVNGVVIDNDVLYNIKKLKFKENKAVKVPFTVVGTQFKGSVTILKPTKDDIDRLGNSQSTPRMATYKAPINKSSHVPVVSLKTLVPLGVVAPKGTTEDGYKKQADKKSDKEQPKGDFAELDKSKKDADETGKSDTSSDSTTDTATGLTNTPKTDVGKQKLATESMLKQANTVTVTYPAILEKSKVKLDASNAFEEYVALSMVNGVTAIDITAFPDYQESKTLSDEVEKIILQNPLIVGVNSWKYDYAKRIISVSYNQPTELIKQQQVSLLESATRMKKQLLEESKATKDKVSSLYTIFNDNSEFGIPDGEKSASVYSLLTGGIGDDLAFAKGYKLLMDMVNIPTIVVSGTFNGKPHVWNKVNFNDEWLNLDMTYNGATVGIPYPIYNLADETADSLNLVENKSYTLDKDIPSFAGISISEDYYYKQQSVVDTVEEYSNILISMLQQDLDKIVIRTSVRLPEQELYDATGSAIQQIAPDKLTTSQFSTWGNYLIVKTKLDEVSEGDAKNQDKQEETQDTKVKVKEDKEKE